MAGGFKTVAPSDHFARDYKRLDARQRAAVDQCIGDLLLPEIPAMRRFHCVNAKRPKIYTLDVFANKSYKISVQVEGTHVILRRVGTHKEIDRNA